MSPETGIACCTISCGLPATHSLRSVFRVYLTPNPAFRRVAAPRWANVMPPYGLKFPLAIGSPTSHLSGCMGNFEMIWSKNEIAPADMATKSSAGGLLPHTPTESVETAAVADCCPLTTSGAPDAFIIKRRAFRPCARSVFYLAGVLYRSMRAAGSGSRPRKSRICCMAGTLLPRSRMQRR